MFKSRFHYNVNSNKQIVTVSPTAGTMVKWFVVPTIISFVIPAVLLVWDLLDEEAEKESYDNLVEELHPEE